MVVVSTAPGGLSEGKKFWRKNGRAVGDKTWSGARIFEITQADRHRVARRELIEKVKSFNFGSLTTTQLLRIQDVIDDKLGNMEDPQ